MQLRHCRDIDHGVNPDGAVDILLGHLASVAGMAAVLGFLHAHPAPSMHHCTGGGGMGRPPPLVL